MKPNLKLVPRAKSTATGERERRVWTNEQLSDAFNDRALPFNWTKKDAVTLVVWRALTACRPGDKNRHIWAELIADMVMDELGS